MTADIALPKDWDRSGLPGWAYFSQELFELECETLFKTHWQFVCHVNEAAEIGAYVTFDVAGERALVIRGHDGIFAGLSQPMPASWIADCSGCARGLQ